MPTLYIPNTNYSLLVCTESTDFCMLTLYFAVLLVSGFGFYFSLASGPPSSHPLPPATHPCTPALLLDAASPSPCCPSPPTPPRPSPPPLWWIQNLWDCLWRQTWSMNNNNFIFPFQSVYLFIFLSYHIVLARTSRMMLNRKYKKEYPYFVLDLERKCPVFHDLSMLVECFWRWSLSSWGSYFVRILLRGFFLSECLILSNAFQCQLIWSHGFSSFAFDVVDYIDWLMSTEPALYTWNKFHLVGMHSVFVHWIWLTFLILPSLHERHCVQILLVFSFGFFCWFGASLCTPPQRKPPSCTFCTCNIFLF